MNKQQQPKEMVASLAPAQGEVVAVVVTKADQLKLHPP